MQLRYGSSTFETNSVNVALRMETLLNGRGVPYAQAWSANVDGYLTGDTTATLSASALALENALAVPYKDFALYDDNGSITHVALLNSGSTTGVVPSNLSFPTGRGAELVTFRSFAFMVRAEYPLTGGATMLQEFTETITVQGTGGPRFILKPALAGLPQRQITQQSTIVRATQAGSAVGYLARPFPPNPHRPDAEHLDQRQITQTAPRFRGKQFENFGVQWSYAFSSAVPLLGTPNAR